METGCLEIRSSQAEYGRFLTATWMPGV